MIGNIAVSSMPDDVAGGFHNIPIEVRSLAPGVYQARGISNTHLIVTTEGNVLFDAGISIQAAQQLTLLKEKSDALVKYIILSHSHADHIGGVRFCREDTTDIVVHREFAEEQRYLHELEPYFGIVAAPCFPGCQKNLPQTLCWPMPGYKALSRWMSGITGSPLAVENSWFCPLRVPKVQTI